jgi:hypothetical protein
MASRNAQTHAKRARELALRERRERKGAKRAAQHASALERSSGGTPSTPETADPMTGSDPKEDEHGIR